MHLLRGFELRMAAAAPPVTYTHAVTLPMKHGLLVEVTERGVGVL